MANFLSTVFWLLVLIVAGLGAIAWTSYNKLQAKAQAIKESALRNAHNPHGH